MQNDSKLERIWKNQMEIFEEGYRNFNLKPLTKEEVAYFIDFAREQYLVRGDDIREALKIVQYQKELQRQNNGGNRGKWQS